MDKKAIIATLAKQLSRDNKDITSLLDGFICVLKDNLGNLDTIAIPGFGEFVPEKQDEKIVLNKESRKQMLLPPQINVSFKASTALRKKISE